ncbi:MAG: hypothetical protein AAB929_05645 [Patescibacteria group bacterium]
MGITDRIVQSWLKKGLKITYPMLQNIKYYKSEDGPVFVENGDKYVIPLSQKEITLYTNNPEIFKRDFLQNVKLYVTFINWLHTLQPETKSLEQRERFASLLLILYLFQRGMDHHYYHFDRYLAYQNYPDTPVGFWWKKLKDACRKISKHKKQDPDILFLKLLTKDEQVPIEYKDVLTASEYNQLTKTLKNIRIFEDAQQEEAELVTDKNKQENIFFRTAIPIWDDLMDVLKKYPELFKPEFQSKIIEVTEGHPLIVIRLILSPEGLHYMDSEILRMFEKEIKRWV